MKNPMSTTKKLLLAILICTLIFIIGCIFYVINEKSFIAEGIIVIVTFGYIILIPSLIIHILKRISNRLMSSHNKFESKNHPIVNPNSLSRFKVQDTCYSTSKSEVRWFHVFFPMLVLFPIGIYFLIQKVSHEKTRYLSNGAILTVVGSAFFVFTAPITYYFACAAAGDLRTMVFVTAFPGTYMLVGLAILIIGLALHHKGKTYEKYMILIAEYEITNLDTLASELNVSYSDVTNTLQKITDIGLLPDSYIYHRDREIIVPGISKKIALRCSTCMGTTVLYSNDEQVCVYCGGQL